MSMTLAITPWPLSHSSIRVHGKIYKLKVAKCELTAGDAEWVSPKLNFSQFLRGKLKQLLMRAKINTD